MYDRTLIEYLPPVLQDVREYKALMNAENFEHRTQSNIIT